MAKVDSKYKTPAARAKARARRNGRSISTPKGEHKRYFKFQAAAGAVAGKPGDKVYGVPVTPTVGVHSGDDGRSAMGVNAEWAIRHTRAIWQEHCRAKARKLARKVLEELRSMPRPKLVA